MSSDRKPTILREFIELPSLAPSAPQEKSRPAAGKPSSPPPVNTPPHHLRPVNAPALRAPAPTAHASQPGHVERQWPDPGIAGKQKALAQLNADINECIKRKTDLQLECNQASTQLAELKKRIHDGHADWPETRLATLREGERRVAADLAEAADIVRGAREEASELLARAGLESAEMRERMEAEANARAAEVQRTLNDRNCDLTSRIQQFEEKSRLAYDQWPESRLAELARKEKQAAQDMQLSAELVSRATDEAAVLRNASRVEAERAAKSLDERRTLMDERDRELIAIDRSRVEQVAEAEVRAAALQVQLRAAQSDNEGLMTRVVQGDAKIRTLEGSASDLASRNRALASEVKSLDAGNRGVKALLVQVEAKAVALEGSVADLTKRNRALGSEVRGLREGNDALRKKVEECDNALGQMKESLGSIEEALDSMAGALFPGCPHIAEWLQEMVEVESSLNWTTAVASTGFGPLAESMMDSILRRFEHNAVPCGDQDAGVLIVGRDSWSESKLSEHVEARSGDSLRIYSQEMALVALLTGHDPFDADEEVLKEFGDSHPALKLLMGNEFAWPSTGQGAGGGTIVIPADWHQQSPLTAMGYRVGLGSYLTDASRRSLLMKIFKGRLAFPPDFSSDERSRWGDPSSAKRLRMVAEHIAGNITLHGGRLGYGSVAVNEWRSDLDWMKHHLYDRGHGFHWPDTTV